MAERVGDEGEPALNRVTGRQPVGAAAAAGEDHDIGQALGERPVKQVAEPGVVREVADAGDDDTEPNAERRSMAGGLFETYGADRTPCVPGAARPADSARLGDLSAHAPVGHLLRFAAALFLKL